MGFVVGRVASRKVCLRIFQFSPATLTLPVPHTHISFTTMNLATHIVVVVIVDDLLVFYN
jgi:hypothetical protein